jgi:hypothetical protein
MCVHVRPGDASRVFGIANCNDHSLINKLLAMRRSRHPHAKSMRDPIVNGPPGLNDRLVAFQGDPALQFHRLVKSGTIRIAVADMMMPRKNVRHGNRAPWIVAISCLPRQLPLAS